MRKSDHRSPEGRGRRLGEVSDAVAAPTIVALGPVPALVEERLKTFGRLVTVGEAESWSPSLLSGAVGLVARGSSVVDEQLLASAPCLRVIGRSGVGVELVDLRAATRRKIPVVVTPGAGSEAVAEGTLALILSLVKRLARLTELVRTQSWSERETVSIGDLHGACLGLVGYGNIGRRVAELARVFGMRVAVYDPYLVPGSADDRVEVLSLEKLLRVADVLSLHAPLTKETRGLIGAEELGLLKKGAVLVNCARGGLVDLDAVYDALMAGRLAGVGIDVFDPEPPQDHPVLQHPNVVLTPHVMGLTPRARRLTFQAMADGMVAVLAGGRALHIANPELYEQDRNIAAASCSGTGARDD